MRHFILTILIFTAFYSVAQLRIRKFSTTINHPSINVFAPYISADNRSLVFLADNTTDNILTMFYSQKIDAVNWGNPVMIPKNKINGGLSFIWGFALNADGTTLYITSLQEGGLGGFDIHTSLLKESIWSKPLNIGSPINSSAQEASPSISLDENTLYFMRCENMTKKTAEGCTLFVSTKSQMGKWGNPIALPPHINTGNSQTPRILADGTTLLFSSDKFPKNKGKMDLYFTQFNGYKWSKPHPLNFANTDNDDQYVSASAFGRYLLKDQPGTRKNEIVEILFSPQTKPKSCMRVDGEITRWKDSSALYVSIFDLQKQAYIYNKEINKKGVFSLFLVEGGDYHLAVEAANDNYTFYSKIYNLTNNIVPLSKITIEIKPVSTDTELNLEGITFEPHTSKLTVESYQELRRLTRLIKANPNYTFTIDVTFNGYQTDSFRSSIDLTEQKIDTLYIPIIHPNQNTKNTNSISIHPNNPDSILSLKEPETEQIKKNNLSIPSIVTDSTMIKITYHNDRTELQAKSIIDYLIKKGIPRDRLMFSHKASKENEVGLKVSKGTTTVRMKVIK